MEKPPCPVSKAFHLVALLPVRSLNPFSSAALWGSCRDGGGPSGRCLSCVHAIGLWSSLPRPSTDSRKGAWRAGSPVPCRGDRHALTGLSTNAQTSICKHLFARLLGSHIAECHRAYLLWQERCINTSVYCAARFPIVYLHQTFYHWQRAHSLDNIFLDNSLIP